MFPKLQRFASAAFPCNKHFKILYTFIQPGFQTGLGHNKIYCRQPVTTDKFDLQKQGLKLK